jgi:hypothetical protein
VRIKNNSPAFHFRNKHDENIQNVAHIQTASQLKPAGIKTCMH